MSKKPRLLPTPPLTACEASPPSSKLTPPVTPITLPLSTQYETSDQAVLFDPASQITTSIAIPNGTVDGSSDADATISLVVESQTTSSRFETSLTSLRQPEPPNTPFEPSTLPSNLHSKLNATLAALVTISNSTDTTIHHPAVSTSILTQTDNIRSVVEYELLPSFREWQRYAGKLKALFLSAASTDWQRKYGEERARGDRLERELNAAKKELSGGLRRRDGGGWPVGGSEVKAEGSPPVGGHTASRSVPSTLATRMAPSGIRSTQVTTSSNGPSATTSAPWAVSAQPSQFIGQDQPLLTANWRDISAKASAFLSSQRSTSISLVSNDSIDNVSTKIEDGDNPHREVRPIPTKPAVMPFLPPLGPATLRVTNPTRSVGKASTEASITGPPGNLASRIKPLTSELRALHAFTSLPICSKVHANPPNTPTNLAPPSARRPSEDTASSLISRGQTIHHLQQLLTSRNQTISSLSAENGHLDNEVLRLRNALHLAIDVNLQRFGERNTITRLRGQITDLQRVLRKKNEKLREGREREDAERDELRVMRQRLVELGDAA